MDLITAPLYLLLVLYQFALVTRIIFDISTQYARHWRPQGLVLILAVSVYAVTDPPIKWLQRKIPPLNLGGIALDMAFIIVFLAVIIGQGVVRAIA
ncbi:YggT family protein [Nesterenkonia alba]|uniref:YggT family protein n=1 Tax=Nesterenkonia alba TaxID=515814 RepID=UPI0003B6FBA5|nr:YggT family protein [Nesterenkonia alba]